VENKGEGFLDLSKYPDLVLRVEGISEKRSRRAWRI